MRLLTKGLLATALVAPGLEPMAAMVPTAEAAGVFQPDDDGSKARAQADQARRRIITRALLQRHEVFQARLRDIERRQAARQAREAREAAEQAAREAQRREQIRIVTAGSSRSTTSGGTTPTFVTGASGGVTVVSAGTGVTLGSSTTGSGGGGSGGGSRGGSGGGFGGGSDMDDDIPF